MDALTAGYLPSPAYSDCHAGGVRTRQNGCIGDFHMIDPRIISASLMDLPFRSKKRGVPSRPARVVFQEHTTTCR